MCCCQVSWDAVACFRCCCWAGKASLQRSPRWWGPPAPSWLRLWVYSWLRARWIQRKAFFLAALPHLDEKQGPPPSKLCFCFGFLASSSPLHPSPPGLFFPQCDAVSGFRNTPSSWARPSGSKLPGFVCGLWLWDRHEHHRARKCSECCSRWDLLGQS